MQTLHEAFLLLETGCAFGAHCAPPQQFSVMNAMSAFMRAKSAE
jgi:hypothetical protein